jgi:hypothetical protein
MVSVDTGPMPGLPDPDLTRDPDTEVFPCLHPDLGKDKERPHPPVVMTNVRTKARHIFRMIMNILFSFDFGFVRLFSPCEPE